MLILNPEILYTIKQSIFQERGDISACSQNILQIDSKLKNKLDNWKKITINEKIEILKNWSYFSSSEDFITFYNKSTRYLMRDWEKLWKKENTTINNIILLELFEENIINLDIEETEKEWHLSKITSYINLLKWKEKIKIKSPSRKNIIKIYESFKKNNKLNDEHKLKLLKSLSLSQEELEKFFNKYIKDYNKKLNYYKTDEGKKYLISFYQDIFNFYENNYNWEKKNNFINIFKIILNKLEWKEINIDISEIYNDFKNKRWIKNDIDKIYLLKSKLLTQKELSDFFNKYKRYFIWKTKFFIKSSLTLWLEFYSSLLEEYKRLDNKNEINIKIIQKQIDYLTWKEDIKLFVSINKKPTKKRKNTITEEVETIVEKLSIPEKVIISNINIVYNLLNNKTLYTKWIEKLKLIKILTEKEKENIIYKLKSKDLIYFYNNWLLKSDNSKTNIAFFHKIYEKFGVTQDFKNIFIRIWEKLIKDSTKEKSIIYEKIWKTKKRFN